ncbi:hypothetical protein AOLI_G00283140 [Acnodon oligacanthus]
MFHFAPLLCVKRLVLSYRQQQSSSSISTKLACVWRSDCGWTSSIQHHQKLQRTAAPTKTQPVLGVRCGCGEKLRPIGAEDLSLPVWVRDRKAIRP